MLKLISLLNRILFGMVLKKLSKVRNTNLISARPDGGPCVAAAIVTSVFILAYYDRIYWAVFPIARSFAKCRPLTPEASFASSCDHCWVGRFHCGSVANSLYTISTKDNNDYI